MHRRLSLLLVLPLLLMVAATACGGDDSSSTSTGRLNVVATIAPVAALATEVGGGLIDLTVLAGTGIDPHEYEMRPDDRKAIDKARVILREGLGIDAFLDRAIEGNTGKVVTLTSGLTLAGGTDPHIWHDVDLDKAMVDTIAKAFSAADPPNAAAYAANATAYRAKLDDADRQVKALIDSIPPANRKMVTNHDAFGYFIRRYGLIFVGAVIPSQTTQSEPSAGDIAALEDLVKKEKVKAIFAESSVDPKVARQVAADTGAKIIDDLYGDTLGEPGSGAETIDGMLIANAKKIAEALK